MRCSASSCAASSGASGEGVIGHREPSFPQGWPRLVRAPRASPSDAALWARSSEHVEPIDIETPGRCNRVGHRMTGDRKGRSRSWDVVWESVHSWADDAALIILHGIFRTRKVTCATFICKVAVAYYDNFCGFHHSCHHR